MATAANKSRTELRETVMLRARIVDSRGTHQARISDISPRGLLGTMENPPQRGDFISIHFPAQELGGQVRWVNGRQFGVRLREQIDATSLHTGKRSAPKAKNPFASRDEEEMSLKSTIVTYGVLGLTALSTAYLIVTYIIF